MAKPWREHEVDHVIDVYFSMLQLELAGQAYSKATFRSQLLSKIDRSNGSAEYKFQNISAVLAELGAIFIDGYKPARNVQELLRSRVTDRFEQAADLRKMMLHAVEAPVVHSAETELAPSPVPEVSARDWLLASNTRTARRIDYQLIEARNRALGLAGEEAVVRFERRRLEVFGRTDLAEKVRHVSVLDGDGLGFDILSFTPAGEERYIEVKTTRFSSLQPFLVSRGEVDFSVEVSEKFALVRVFRFETSRPGFYELTGSLRSTAELRANTFVGVPAPTSA